MKAINALFFGALFTLGACSKEEAPADGAPGNGGDPTPTSEYYFQADINGTNTLIEDAISGYSNKNGSTDDGNVKRSYAALSNTSDNNSLEILMIGDLGKPNPNIMEVYSLFSTGAQSFSNRTNSGVIINWKDDTGKTWTTDTRFGSSSSSSVVFNEVGAASGGAPTFKVTGTISCRVYDLIGDFKTIESGKFSLLFDASK